MKTVKEIFGKEPENLELPDISNFFTGSPRESQHLEFKSGEVATAKLQKEVCAFLNSEGGVIVLGAPREGGVNDNQLDLSNIPDTSGLLQAMVNGIVPAPRGIKVYQVQGPEGSVFLIEVPPSTTPPHQLPGSGQYYMRQGAVSRPAYHEEVEKMFMEQRKPTLDLKIEIERPDDALLVRLIVGNESSISAFEPGFNLRCMPVRFQDNGRFERQLIAKDNYLAEGQQWLQEFEIYPSEPRFFLHCQYFCRDVKPQVKAAFAEIQNRKVELLSVFNSNVHDDYSLWYEENLYLLND